MFQSRRMEGSSESGQPCCCRLEGRSRTSISPYRLRLYPWLPEISLSRLFPEGWCGFCLVPPQILVCVVAFLSPAACCRARVRCNVGSRHNQLLLFDFFFFFRMAEIEQRFLCSHHKNFLACQTLVHTRKRGGCRSLGEGRRQPSVLINSC